MGPQLGYVTGLELESIRGFKHLKMDFNGDAGPRKLSVIIGRNGTCKSTLLRCIALGLCHESDVSALLAQPSGRLVSEGANDGHITLWVATASGEPLGEIRLQSASVRDATFFASALPR